MVGYCWIWFDMVDMVEMSLVANHNMQTANKKYTPNMTTIAPNNLRSELDATMAAAAGRRPPPIIPSATSLRLHRPMNLSSDRLGNCSLNSADRANNDGVMRPWWRQGRAARRCQRHISWSWAPRRSHLSVASSSACSLNTTHPDVRNRLYNVTIMIGEWGTITDHDGRLQFIEYFFTSVQSSPPSPFIRHLPANININIIT